ncbi:MAG: glycosyl hydrolase [Bacteroidetes bacterium]|nr:MAG: glycosyl hydrolase [Bacteroidota bacterium]
MKKLKLLLIGAFFLMNLPMSYGQSEKVKFSDTTFIGLKLRNIGPSFMSGRIADIAIHPQNENIWYVAVGSGGVWKTLNAGVTWKPIFDKEASYSTGCVTIDPSNPEIIWVGTGENVGGRHVGYGDGIYLSTDGGGKWKNMGLKKSEHISKIIVHPENSNIVWVAVQGPLWSKGGERGLYKTINGGKTWKNVLSVNEWTGVTDLLIDPRNPNRLYAASWQKHRNVAAYMGGGSGSGIYRSEDGGEYWTKLKSGLPGGNIGKIGIAISPQKPDVIYAAIELNRRKGAVYQSTNRGESWVKGADAISGGTGPHYYQELYASPHQFNLIYLVDVRMQVSEDGGKTFKRMNEKFKHSDNHAIAFRKTDPNYMLVGTDGGIYESFDQTKNWRYLENLPLTQYYKVAVDDSKPFYNIYGGTQDNNTQVGPSRTDNFHGIRNADWEVVLFADGHQPATEPGNPNIVYAEWQQGNLVRIDRTTGEVVHIQPQPFEGDGVERFNWDAPILVSPHSPTTIFHASQRVWKSTDRGNNWTAISGDLTRNQERIILPIMGKKQSWDSPWDMFAMSTYNTITSLAESPKKEGLIYAGTDDGFIQVTEDGGNNWRRIEVSKLSGVPATAFVNDIKADLFDANTAYIALDNHKYGDYTPYLFKSTNMGKSWVSIRGNIPNRTLVWRIVQDHVKPNLLFAATEFGIYFTIDGGKKWTKLKGGTPTISFRDLAIQRRENDLVGASFGRGFFVFDDYSVLRHISNEQMNNEATLFPVKDAWWYIQRSVIGFSENAFAGANLYMAANPPFGAVFTYYLKDGLKSKKQIRQEKEAKLNKANKDIPFPGWAELEIEHTDIDPAIWLTVTDAEGNVIRRIKGKNGKSFHRIAWDLRYPASNVIKLDDNKKKPENPFDNPSGNLVVPGIYKVQLSKQENGKITVLSEFMEFKVKQMRKGSIEGPGLKETEEFWKDIAEIQKSISAFSVSLDKAIKKVDAMRIALSRAYVIPGQIDEDLLVLRKKLIAIEAKLNGNHAKSEMGELSAPGIRNRLGSAFISMRGSTYGPTGTHKVNLLLAQKEYVALKSELSRTLKTDIPKMEKALQDAGAPWIEGQELPKK